VPVQEAENGLIPPGSELVPYAKGGAFELVRKRSVVTGEMLTNATTGFDQNGGSAVDFRFNSVGGRKFGEVTSQNIGKRFAIILDGKVISAPVIQSAITGGSGQITSMGSPEAASELVLLLRNGALPVKLVTIQQGTVGAELGADAVHAGMVSTIVGFVAIVIFMVLSYGVVFGGVSVLALMLNVLMIFGFMSLSQSTLTLPGVAGLILTLAVAVDANVLIYERIRDEERAGHPPLMALDTGFRRASVSILDANITSLIAALIMMAQGSGPVKGFATMLAVGVFTSVFTAMLVSQVLLGAWFRAARPKTLPI
jgi:preprotein translocase subunit SecD